MSAQVIDNLMEQIKNLKLQLDAANKVIVSKTTNEKQNMQTLQEEDLERNISLTQAIAQLKAKLVMYRHLTSKSQECIIQLSTRLRYRTPDDMSSYPGDRAALLDADMVLSQIYKTFQAEQA